MKKVSFVIPCYQSEKTLPMVIEEIENKMLEMAERFNYDIYLVDDCSTDSTGQVIKELCKKKEYIKGISFAKNFGQHSALMAGLRYCDGEYVICLDDDGQTPADEVDKLLDKLDEGFDAVYAKYTQKKHSLFRNIGSKINERMTRIMLEKPADLYVSSYFAVRRFVVEDMIRYEYSYPYVIGLVLRTTKNITNVEINHRERQTDKSGYTFKKLIGLWFNGFTAFSVIPLRVATSVGIAASIVGFIYGIYTIIRRLLNPAIVMGFAALMSAQIFFGGMIMILLGIIGEYVGRIYISMNNSPQYVIRDKWGV